MKITCNRIGGYSIFGLALSHGENEVDADTWREVAARCLPEWLAKVTSGDPPDLVLHNETPPELVESPELQEKIKAVNDCYDLKQVEAMAQNELRLPVLEAIDRRIDQLELP